MQGMMGQIRIVAEREGAVAVAARVANLADGTQQAVDAMRIVARGIYPPLLEAEGLGAALAAAHRTVTLPIQIDSGDLPRYSRQVEETVYFCVVAAVGRAEMAGATSAHVIVQGDDVSLTVNVSYDSADDGTDLSRLTDRIDAFGGTITTAPSEEGTTLTVLGGKSFMLGGSTDLTEEAPGIFSGDLSGIMAANAPAWFRSRMFPSRELALLSDWEAKVSRLAETCTGEDIRLIGGTPSWLLIFFDALAELRGLAPNLATLFPNLEVLVHGGVDFSPYRRRFTDLLAGSHAELREVYPASEGFIAAADRDDGEGLLLNLSHGLFFEFVPVEELDAATPTRHWIADAEPGVNYALVLSTCAGLWAYVLGDTVELVEGDRPRVKVTGRTSYMLSAFGEHLIASEVEAAVGAAAAEIGASVSDWSVGPVFPEHAGALGS